jgi:hypothetical protein
VTAAAEMATTPKMTAATATTTAMRRGDRHRRTAQGKRRDDCQHCPAHNFLTLSGVKAKRAGSPNGCIKNTAAFAFPPFPDLAQSPFPRRCRRPTAHCEFIDCTRAEPL